MKVKVMGLNPGYLLKKNPESAIIHIFCFAITSFATIEEIPSTHLLSFYSVIVLIFFHLIAVKENNWARSFQTMKGTYATKGNQWVSYNDVQFVKEKADYVIKNKYGGVAVFTMDMDDFNNNCCQVRFIEIKWL